MYVVCHSDSVVRQRTGRLVVPASRQMPDVRERYFHTISPRGDFDGISILDPCGERSHTIEPHVPLRTARASVYHRIAPHRDRRL